MRGIIGERDRLTQWTDTGGSRLASRVRVEDAATSYRRSRDGLSMSLIQHGSDGSVLKATLAAAREELRSDIRRGTGGRAGLERYSDRVDGLLRQLFVDAGTS